MQLAQQIGQLPLHKKPCLSGLICSQLDRLPLVGKQGHMLDTCRAGCSPFSVLQDLLTGFPRQFVASHGEGRDFGPNVSNTGISEDLIPFATYCVTLHFCVEVHKREYTTQQLIWQGTDALLQTSFVASRERHVDRSRVPVADLRYLAV